MNAPSPTMPKTESHVDWERATVSHELHCRRCGYDLRGLRADGRCPECGLEIWATVQHTVDPAASRLPSLANPRAVGDSLLVLTVCMLAGAVLLLVPSATEFITELNYPALREWALRIPSLNWVAAAVLGVIGLLAVWNLAPPRGRETHGAGWRDICRLAIGWVGWLGCAWGWAGLHGRADVVHSTEEWKVLVLHAAAVAFATIGLLGLRGVMRIIGLRSREYRQSRSGRQSLDLLILAIMLGLLAAAARDSTWIWQVSANWVDELVMVGTVVQWTSMFMVLIGLAYLVMNAWWIRQALRRPPPPIEGILDLKSPQGD